MIVKIIYSILFSTPIIALSYLTIYANNHEATKEFALLLGISAILATFVFANKIGEIWATKIK